MEWRPNGYMLTTKELVHAIFDKSSDASKLLLKGCTGEIEIFASPKSWNAILWLVMNTLKVDGIPVYTGPELLSLRDSLPIVWQD
tara:strand:+ start:811 stop:1065 length:255 start_codon:yes stop_codon:yes gene_type:complete